MPWISPSKKKRKHRGLRPILTVLMEFAEPVIGADPKLETPIGRVMFQMATIAWTEGGLRSAKPARNREHFLAWFAEVVGAPLETIVGAYEVLVADRQEAYGDDPRVVVLQRFIPRPDGSHVPQVHAEAITGAMSIEDQRAAIQRIFDAAPVDAGAWLVKDVASMSEVTS
jgi:hypothetical protein